MEDNLHKLIIIPYSGDELNAEDLLATNKISRPSAVRLLKKYSEQLSRCCLPAAAVTELSVGITDDGITLEGKGFGNETVAGLIKGCDSVWLYHVTSGTEMENAECFDSASMRDMFAFAAMLKMNKELNEYFRRDIGLSSPENLLAQAGRELTEEDNMLLSDLGKEAMDRLGITVDSRGLLRPWNTLWGVIYEKRA